jgi:hypothetical protein
MAYADIPTLKRSFAAQLEEIMPTDWDGKHVPVDYAWPGTDQQRPLHVWLFNARSTSTPGPMGGRPYRRDQTWALDVVIEGVHKGATLDRSGRNVLQEKVDAAIVQIAGLIDEWVAANPQLGQTTSSDVPVDFASFDSFTLEQGLPESGATARGTCTISVRIRPK